MTIQIHFFNESIATNSQWDPYRSHDIILYDVIIGNENVYVNNSKQNSVRAKGEVSLRLSCHGASTDMQYDVPGSFIRSCHLTWPEVKFSHINMSGIIDTSALAAERDWSGSSEGPAKRRTARRYQQLNAELKHVWGTVARHLQSCDDSWWFIAGGNQQQQWRRHLVCLEELGTHRFTNTLFGTPWFRRILTLALWCWLSQISHWLPHTPHFPLLVPSSNFCDNAPKQQQQAADFFLEQSLPLNFTTNPHAFPLISPPLHHHSHPRLVILPIAIVVKMCTFIDFWHVDPTYGIITWSNVVKGNMGWYASL